MPHDYIQEYFEIDIDDALRLAAKQMNTTHEELSDWDNHNYKGFVRHQLLTMTEVISFLGALVAAQRREIDTLQTTVRILEHYLAPEKE